MLSASGPLLECTAGTPKSEHGQNVSDCLYVAVGELLPMFKACMPVTRCDIQSARFLMPYLLHNVISAGSPESRKGAAPCTALVILPHHCTACPICAQPWSYFLICAQP